MKELTWGNPHVGQLLSQNPGEPKGVREPFAPSRMLLPTPVSPPHLGQAWLRLCLNVEEVSQVFL